MCDFARVVRDALGGGRASALDADIDGAWVAIVTYGNLLTSLNAREMKDKGEKRGVEGAHR